MTSIDSNQFDRILFIGRLCEQKNLRNLCYAVKEVEIGLDIIGHGELEQELHSIVEKNEIDVRFLGVFPNNKLPEIISMYRIFILPSFYENNPKTLLEAMACGRAVIGSNVDGIKEIISHRNNGYLCETSSFSISRAIRALTSNSLLCSQLAKNARKYVEKYHNLDTILNNERKIYLEVAG